MDDIHSWYLVNMIFFNLEVGTVGTWYLVKLIFFHLEVGTGFSHTKTSSSGHPSTDAEVTPIMKPTLIIFQADLDLSSKCNSA